MNAPAHSAAVELVHELRRQEENCDYSAASLFLWFKFLRALRAIAMTLQVVFGALATWRILTQDYQLLTAVFALLAAIIGPFLAATKIGDEIDRSKAAAAEFTALRDRFRRAALVDVHKPLVEFESAAKLLFDRMDAARLSATAPPELFFQMARRKIRKGHFRHDYDERRASDGAPA